MMFGVKKFGLAVAAALVLLLGLAGIAAAQPGSISGILSSPYTNWFPIVMAAALVVLVIVSLVYMLSPLIGRSELRAWARLQFYSVLFSILLIIIFEFFGALIYNINPEPTMNGMGLVPISCTGSANIFELSLCDIYQFNQVTVNLVNYDIFLASIRAAIMPNVLIGFSVPGISNLGLQESFQLEPISSVAMMGSLIKALALAYTLNQVQLIIIAASMLIFAVFMSIGLIARIFGITRSFGGAMIAFALGIGFVYPLMVSVTYGFINYIFSSGTGMEAIVQAFFYSATFLSFFSSGAIVLAGLVLGGAVIGISTILQLFGVSGSLLLELLEYVGLVGIGLLFVPLLNFMIVDTFIIDFSQAIGERMDFMSLLTGLI